MFKPFTTREWDSHFFDKQIFAIDLSNTDIPTVNWPCNSLITAKISSNNYKTLDQVNKYGLSFVEGEIVFQKKLLESDDLLPLVNSDNYLATEENIDELKSIVKNLYRSSRFREPWFSSTERDRFYQTWIENAVLSKFDDCCLVLKSEGAISGFVSIRIKGCEAVIGLIGVAGEFQGQGVGSKLLTLVEAYCAANKVKNIKVATQTSNTPAANLYSKNGFCIADISYWFYKQV